VRVCSGAGCLRAVPDDVRFCDECKPTAADTDGIRKHSSGYTPELDALKKSTRWQRLRVLVLRAQPLCVRCQKRVAHEVDHIVPAQEAIAQAQVSGRFIDKYAGYFIRSNLQGLCRACHAAKTLEDKRHVGPWPDVLAIDDAKPKKVWTF
jgi:5-methylcytosine-specific restriction endonuclease McrA